MTLNESSYERIGVMVSLLFSESLNEEIIIINYTNPINRIISHNEKRHKNV